MYYVDPLMGEATVKKRAQLWCEIQQVPDEILRSNIEHSFYKFQSFLDDDLAPYLPKPLATDTTPPDLREVVRRARGGDPPVQLQGYT